MRPVTRLSVPPRAPDEVISNVYARYFTPTVQQVSLPAGTTRFSLTDNDQTIEQISVTAGTPPTGDATANGGFAGVGAVATDIFGTFTLWYDANGNGTVDTNAPAVVGGTQSEELVVNYDEADPTVAAQQIQAWLNNFVPVTGISDGTHATVNAIAPDTFVVDYGKATEGLNQSPLLQYIPTECAVSLPGTDLNFHGGRGQEPRYRSIPGRIHDCQCHRWHFGLQVGTVQTATITVDIPAQGTALPAVPATPTTPAIPAVLSTYVTQAQLNVIAAHIQTALVDAGFTGTTVTVTEEQQGFNAIIGPPQSFLVDVNFPTAEPPVQYLDTAATGFGTAAFAAQLYQCPGRFHAIGILAGGVDYDPRRTLHNQQYSRLAVESRAYGRGHRRRLHAASRRGDRRRARAVSISRRDWEHVQRHRSLYRAGCDHRHNEYDPEHVYLGAADDRRRWLDESVSVHDHVQRLCQRRHGRHG